MDDQELGRLVDDVVASGLTDPEALKAKKPEPEEPEKKPEGEDGDPEASVEEEGEHEAGEPGEPGDSVEAEGEHEEANKGEPEEVVAVEVEEFLKALHTIIAAEVSAALAPVVESLKCLQSAAAAGLGLSKNALQAAMDNGETLKAQAETMKAMGVTAEALKSLATTPAATPPRPGAAVSRRLPTPANVSDPTVAPLTVDEVGKALNLSRIAVSLHDRVVADIKAGRAVDAGTVSSIRSVLKS